jgi:hypothetical protein
MSISSSARRGDREGPIRVYLLIILLGLCAGTCVGIPLTRALQTGDVIVVSPADDYYRDGMVIDAYFGQSDCEQLRMRKWLIFVWYEPVTAPAGSGRPRGG